MIIESKYSLVEAVTYSGAQGPKNSELLMTKDEFEALRAQLLQMRKGRQRDSSLIHFEGSSHTDQDV